MNTLASIWISIIAFAILLYVILDGFDLGIGIISIFFPKPERDIMISSILPVWDGNETWLVFGGASLYGAFPLAFSLLLPVLYLPLLLMVLALIFRGVSFEFRLKAETNKNIWDIAFFAGSLIATILQGILLGTFVQGFPILEGKLIIPSYQWLTPFSLTCGVSLVFGYALLGVTWLIGKTTNHLQEKCYGAAKKLLIIIAVAAVLLSFWTPFVDTAIKARWLNPIRMGYLALLPLASVVIWLLNWISLNKKNERAPFWLTIGIFLACYLGFIISSWPYIVPRSIPFWQACAPKSSLIFMLVGALIMLPILLFYTYHSYRIFRGKVTEVIHY